MGEALSFRGTWFRRGLSGKKPHHPSKLEMLVVWTQRKEAETARVSRSGEMDGCGEGVRKSRNQP